VAEEDVKQAQELDEPLETPAAEGGSEEELETAQDAE
jgi:hypothetical protein